MRITGQGLSLTGLLVVLLWACLIGEKVIVRHARADYARAMRDVYMLRMRQQQPRRIPVSAPVPRVPHTTRPVAG